MSRSDYRWTNHWGRRSGTALLVALSFWPSAASAAITFDPATYLVDTPAAGVFVVRVADFDQDGRPDIVAAEEYGAISLYRNRGDAFGVLWERTTIATLSPPVPDYVVLLDVADLDGDGWIDLVASQSGGEIFALQNDHTPFGPWTAIPIVTLPNTDATARVVLELADFDSDGWLDLATLDSEYSGDTGYLRVFRNDGSPFDDPWSTSKEVASGYANSAGLVAGDLDNDGDVDLAFASNEYNDYLAQNDGSPWDDGWSTIQIGSHGFGMASGYALADIDANGYLDLATACPYQPLESQHVYGNDGTPFDGGWTDQIFGVASPAGIVVGDLDLDGDLDLACGENANRPSQCTAWSNDGSPFDDMWSEAGIAVDPGHASTLELGDLDGDGDLDIVLSIQDTVSPRIRILRNLAIVHEPVIAAVKDVPNDQGGKVLVEWQASDFDTEVDRRIGFYSLWRRIEEPAALLALATGAVRLDEPVARVPERAVRMRTEGVTTSYWEYIAEIPARNATGYAYTVSTHTDSMPGNEYVETFFVEAYDLWSETWWLSPLAGGYSVDNLSPATPTSFTGTYTLDTTRLHWQPNTEADFKEYAIYRSPVEDGPYALIATQPDTGYTDAVPEGRYYRLAAFDVHGNESPFVQLNPTGTAVSLFDLTALQEGAAVVLRWRTADESRLRAFRIFRARGKGLFEPLVPDVEPNASRTYVYRDATPVPGPNVYRIGEVGLDGTVVLHGWVPVDIAGRVPGATVLHSPYPNPFNPSTTLVFDLATDASVVLDVLDVQGRNVRRLMRGEWATAGKRTVVWDGRDDHGQRVASGVYQARLCVNGSTWTRRMTLLK